jgi:hypothetical protein
LPSSQRSLVGRYLEIFACGLGDTRRAVRGAITDDDKLIDSAMLSPDRLDGFTDEPLAIECGINALIERDIINAT